MGQKLIRTQLSLKKHRRTTIGDSDNSKPLNKHSRRMKKPYKGQGK